MDENLLWKASKNLINQSVIKNFSQKIENKFNINFDETFSNFWRWSINNPENFWNEFWDYSNIIGEKKDLIL